MSRTLIEMRVSRHNDTFRRVMLILKRHGAVIVAQADTARHTSIHAHITADNCNACLGAIEARKGVLSVRAR